MRKKMVMIFIGAFGAVAIIIFLSAVSKDEPAAGTEQGGIQFIEGDWVKAVAEAKENKKLIFIDAYATWCGPCKMLKRRTMSAKEAGDFFNGNFVNISIDVERGDGPALSRHFGIYSIPTLIIADTSGNIITYARGFMPVKNLLEFGASGLKARAE